jgi:hypothetical protein
MPSLSRNSRATLGAHNDIDQLCLEVADDGSPALSTNMRPAPRGRESGSGGGAVGGLTTAPTTAELDRESLSILREFAAERIAERRSNEQSHSPCHLCGMASSPQWRGPAKRSGLGTVCGRCAAWLDDQHFETRDLCASVLAGLSTTNLRRAPSGLGATVGLQFFGESDRTEPNSRPWEHVDVRALRAIVADLAAERALTLPPRWNPERRVTW